MQTYLPNHYVINYAKRYDYTGFYAHEINLRKATKFPPFTKLVRILIQSAEDNEAATVTREVYKKIKDIEKQDGEFVYRSPQTGLSAPQKPF